MGCNQSSDGQWAYPVNGNGMSNGGIDPNIGQEALERYIALEEEIAVAETSSPGMVLQQKREQLDKLSKQIQEQESNVRNLEAQTQKEKKDVDDIEAQLSGDNGTKELFIEQNSLEAAKQKELQEYLDAKNIEEIARKELENLKEQKETLTSELQELDRRSERLQDLYKEQDELLDQIFNGAYGSEKENQLENFLDQTEEMRNRIVEANFKWKQAQMMIDYSYKQLEYAVNKWAGLQSISDGSLDQRYEVAVEVRNNLVAASQNLQGAQNYLSSVKFPYCAPPEVDTLNKATAYIFTDMQTPDRHGHAMECYTVTWKRCGALLHWVTQVLHQTIEKDLKDINSRVSEASKNLRIERVRLIKLKVKEVLGKDVHISIKDVNTDVKVQPNLNDLHTTDGIDPALFATMSEDDLKKLLLENDDELAPPPSNQDIFGERLEALTNDLQEDQKRLQQQEEEMHGRVQNHLQEKLQARRKRRARLNLEQKEAEALKGNNG